jgi:hypothetical protein
MNKNEYVNYYNSRQPPNSRKLSEKILNNFENQHSDFSGYNRHAELMEQVRGFVNSLPWQTYCRVMGGESRKRDSSFFKNTKITIKAFPIKENVRFSWTFLAYDLEKKVKYFWNNSSNKYYFNPQEMLDDYLSLRLEHKPLTQVEKNRVLLFLEKYGPLFASKYSTEEEMNKFQKSQELYFNCFYEDYSWFKKSYEIIKLRQPKRFPHAKIPSQTFAKFRRTRDSKEVLAWQAKYEKVQSWFKLMMSLSTYPTIGNPPHDLDNCGRGIGILCHYLYKSCEQLIKCNFCGKYFIKQRRNQTACCMAHSHALASKEYKKKK